jgi:phosphoenolpyruvate carboxykinase (ATP)
MVQAILNNVLNDVEYQVHPVFGLQIPMTCPGVPAKLLDPANTWEDKDDYESAANSLLKLFEANKKANNL